MEGFCFAGFDDADVSYKSKMRSHFGLRGLSVLAIWARS